MTDSFESRSVNAIQRAMSDHGAAWEALSPRFRTFLASRGAYYLPCGRLGCTGLLFGFQRGLAAVGGRIHFGARVQSDASGIWMLCPECSRRNYLARAGWFGPKAIVHVELEATAPAANAGTASRRRDQGRALSGTPDGANESIPSKRRKL
jgi:hypothetical protein